MTVALAVHSVSYAYGERVALADVSFTVHAGECAILLGPNGAGKSTLFNLITRLFDAPSGVIEINGANLRKRTVAALAALGVVFQQPTLDLDLSVRGNLLYHCRLHGLSKAKALLRIEDELNRLGLIERISDPVRQLNGGHRRRLEIARALLHSPTVLLLDEPTVGLDVPSRRSIVEYVHQLATERGVAVLWATHLIDEVFPADRLIVLHRGRVKADATVCDVMQSQSAGSVAEAFERLTDGANLGDRG